MAIEKIIKILFKYDTSNTPTEPNKNILASLKELSDFLEKNKSCCRLQKYKVFLNETHANLLAVPRGAKGPFVMLQGHIDTVPFEGDYRFKIGSDFLRGRGAVDMKGSLAGMVHAFLALCKKADSLKYPPLLLITSDEEADPFKGINLFLEKNRLPLLMAVNGEPTDLKVGAKFYGVLGYRLEARGKSAHSAYPSDRLIEKMIPLIGAVNEFLARAEKISNKRFGKTVAAFTMIRSGVKENQLPGDFTAAWNLRTVENRQVYERIFKELVLERVPRNAKIESFSFDPLESSVSSAMKSKIKKAFSDSGLHYRETKIKFFTEASILNKNNVPTVVCGPGNPVLAHGP